jgi:uncharacterized surface anchored protein
MFTEPAVLTVGGSAKSLNKTGTNDFGSKYASADTAYRLTINHETTKTRNRHVIRFDFDSLVANPLITGQNIPQSMSVWLAVNTNRGYDSATAKAVVDALVAYLAATSGANVTKLLGGES